MTAVKSIVQAGWTKHDRQPEALASELEAAVNNVTEADLAGFLQLAVHTIVGHLADFNRAQALLECAAIKQFSEQPSWQIQAATVAYCQGKAEQAELMTKVAEDPTTWLKVTAGAAVELLAAKQFNQATQAYQQATALVELASEQEQTNIDCARIYAIASNNIACDLEQNSQLSDDEVKQMVFASQQALLYWRIAGGWIEEERAHYQAAKCQLKAGQLAEALTHAQQCLSICQQNQADQYELFFAHEVLCQVHQATCTDIHSGLPEVDQGWMKVPFVG